MKSNRTSLVLLFVSLLAASPAEAISLRFLGDLNLKTGTKADGTDFGGISGLAYDRARDVVYAISDDKGDLQPPRYYTISYRFEAGRPVLGAIKSNPLLDVSSRSFPKGELDPEAIAYTSAYGGVRYYSSEGNGRVYPRIMPGIFELGSNGRIAARFPIPAKFLPETTGTQTKGVRDNAAFESLTISPRHSIFSAAEMPLVQDDTPADFEKGGLSRIIHFARLKSPSAKPREYVYKIEANPKPEGAVTDLGNGISEMLALNDTELLVVERGTSLGLKGARNRIRIYRASLGGATDVSRVASLKSRSFRPVEKRLVLDLDTILPELDRDFRSTDNIEGMTFGPRLPNGNRTLILVSDNNFNPLQRTQFLAFEIKE